MSDWNCKKCTCVNPEDAERCQACDEPREEEEEEEYDGSSGGEEDEEEEEEGFDELRSSKGFDDVVGSALAKEAKKKVAELANAAKKKLGNAITFLEDEDSCVIRSALSVSFLDATIAKVWGIKFEKPIILELKFDLENYSDKPPQFILYQSGDTDLARYKLKDISSFGLEWQLRARLDDWLNGDKKTGSKPNWPPKDSNFIENILEHVEQRIKNCTSSCIICDGALPFQMIKPAVCEKDLCVHAHEQYGLGADVTSEIRDFPDVVDLLISFCYAITGGDQRRFNPYPIGVEAKRKDDKGNEIVYDFMNGDDKKAKNPPAIRKVLDLIPSVADLGKFPDTKSLKSHLDGLDPLGFPLLRWVITSNRAHLDRLQEKDMIKEMNTPYQYMFLSSPPEKEALFQSHKKSKGSFWAFHGSSFANWHSILRIGLKNYSNTPLMSTGAAYGAGIYLAPQSSTSVGYAVSLAGWEKSIFSNDKGSYNNLQCLALCEVINNGYKANPHYVVPDENHVMTRYFFIYNSKHTPPSVQADSLKNVKSSPLAEK